MNRETAAQSPNQIPFNHEPRKWAEFQRRYRKELEAHPEARQPLIEAAQQGAVPLLFSSRDQKHNNAALLKVLLGQRLA